MEIAIGILLVAGLFNCYLIARIGWVGKHRLRMIDEDFGVYMKLRSQNSMLFDVLCWDFQKYVNEATPVERDSE